MRILVTNDDGIDAPGLHHLARAMTRHGDVVVVAPDREFSGASVAIGAIWDLEPEIIRRDLDGVPEAWSVNGPPALCTLFARLGAFGGDFDLVVSGINPGANAGRNVYHSGTVGACIAARNGGWSGVAVSQAAAGWGVAGQAWSEVVSQQKFAVAAEVASAFVGGLVDELPERTVVANINVPNVELDEIAGWAVTDINRRSPSNGAKAALVAKPDQPDHFGLDVTWGNQNGMPADTDAGAIERNLVSVTYVSRLVAEERDDLGHAEAALTDLVGPANLA